MPLSEYEQRMLEQMERQLRSDDPKFADSLASSRRSGSRVLLGVLALVAGIGGLVAGVATQLAWLGILGFVAMFAGVWVALARPAQRAHGAGAPTVSPQGRASARRGFMQRLEERWDRRRDGR